MSNIISDVNLATLIADEQLTKELLGTHLKNDRKVELFYTFFKKFTVGGTFKYDLCFSWYAFFGNIFYFLYRKLYLPALLFAYVIVPGIIICALSVIGITAYIGGRTGGGLASGLVIALLMLALYLLPPITFAMSGIYLYTRKFLRDLELSGYGKLDIERVKENLSLLGGSNDWVITVLVILMFSILIYILIYIPVYLAVIATAGYF